MYTQPLSSVFDSFGVSHVCFADDTQAYEHYDEKDVKSKISNLENCISASRSWMVSNKLSLNAGKTEAMLASKPRMTLSDPPTSIDVDGEAIEFSMSVKLLVLLLTITCPCIAMCSRSAR